MKLFSCSFFFLILLTTLFFSCSKEDTLNAGSPEMSGIRFNVNSQIIFLSDTLKNKYDTIIVNSEKNKPAGSLDTLVLENSVIINRGLLKAPNGLTNTKVKIYGDTAKYETSIPFRSDWPDDCTNITEVPLTYFFGMTEYNIDSINKITVTTSLASTVTKSDTTKNVREGNEYRYNIYLIDREGNIDSTSYFQRPIVIVSKATIIEANIKKVVGTINRKQDNTTEQNLK